MSNPIHYDSYLAAALAAELDAALSDARILGIRLDRAARQLFLACRVQRQERLLVWPLGAGAGAPRLLDRKGPAPNVPIPPGLRMERILTPPDERIIIAEASAAYRVQLIIELMTNQWNVIVSGEAGRIIAVLRPRAAGRRPLEAGIPYMPPSRAPRAGATKPVDAATWHALLGDVAPAERPAALLAKIAYTSPLNTSYLLGAAAIMDDESELAAAYARYRALLAGPVQPVLIAAGGGWQPYPQPLGQPDARPFGSLLEACAALTAEQGETARGTAKERAAGSDAAGEPALATLADQVKRAQQRLARRATRLRAELSGAAAEAAELRHDAGLLLAQLDRVERGAGEVELDDFAGGVRTITLDPARSPAGNAEQMFAAARRRARAAERIPPLLTAAESELARLETWLADHEQGVASAADAGMAATPAPHRRGAAADRPLPYRRYLTSGGIEVRVGRSGKANDELTFHHAAPNDIWLHARDVGGAHVVLRWGDASINPPHRDLVDAAVLAALHSRARTSGTVAVDWTRRKYVRKPRRSKPGLVSVERARTLFVEPDPRVEERLRAD